MSASDNDAINTSLLARRRSVFWRIHFWAALIASPFVLIAVLTGMLYIFTPQIEAVLYDKFDHVTPMGTMRPLDEAIAAAKSAVPAGWTLHSVVLAYDTNDTIKAKFVSPAVKPSSEQAIVVYVNPYTAKVVGSLANKDRFSNWVKKLHSRLLQNDNWRWMIELAASGLMVMLLTGIYLWGKVLPQAHAKGRIAWKQWHSFIGVALSVMTLIILTTGLTWSKYAGEQIRTLRDAVGQAPPQIPLHLHSMLHSMGEKNAVPLTWQTVWDAARHQAPDVAIQLTPPRGQEGTWRASNADRAQPEKKFDLVMDAYSGQTLYYSGWDKQTAFSKATAIGIPFHRGEFGWWNQVLLLIFGVSVLFSLISGWVMFFKRRSVGSFGLPRLLPGAWKSLPLGIWLVAVVLCIAMPLLALSAVVVGIIEILICCSKTLSSPQ